jgi:hypothetical protein
LGEHDLVSTSVATRNVGIPLQREGGLSGARVAVPTAVAFPPFNPLRDINWEAAFWASDPLWANPADGNKVSSWRDGSGNGRDTSQATDANRPTYKANHPEFNNKAAIEFLNSGAHRLTSSTFSVSQPNTWVAIVRFTGSTTNNEHMRIIDNSGIGASRQLMGGRNSTEFVGNAGSAGVLTRSPNNEPSLMVWLANGSSSWVEVNGQRSANVNSGTTGVSGVGIGSDGGTSRLTGAVAFVGLHSGNVTTHRNWEAFTRWASTLYAIK